MNNYVLGLELLVIGMGTVFLSLYLLSTFLFFSGKFLGPKNKVEKKNKAVDKSKTKQKKAAVKADQDQLKDTISAKKLAAVTAAVAEALNGKKNYRIISIQKNSQNWKR